MGSKEFIGKIVPGISNGLVERFCNIFKSGHGIYA